MEAASMLGSMADSLVGSSGRLKYVVDHDGRTVAVSDAVQLLHSLDIEHPIGQVVYQACHSHQKCHETSTKSLLCLIGIWSRSVARLVHQGVHTSDIIQLMHDGIDKCIARLDDIKIPVNILEKCGQFHSSGNKFPVSNDHLNLDRNENNHSFCQGRKLIGNERNPDHYELGANFIQHSNADVKFALSERKNVAISTFYGKENPSVLSEGFQTNSASKSKEEEWKDILKNPNVENLVDSDDEFADCFEGMEEKCSEFPSPKPEKDLRCTPTSNNPEIHPVTSEHFETNRNKVDILEMNCGLIKHNDFKQDSSSIKRERKVLPDTDKICDSNKFKFDVQEGNVIKSAELSSNYLHSEQCNPVSSVLVINNVDNCKTTEPKTSTENFGFSDHGVETIPLILNMARKTGDELDDDDSDDISWFFDSSSFLTQNFSDSVQETKNTNSKMASLNTKSENLKSSQNFDFQVSKQIKATESEVVRKHSKENKMKCINREQNNHRAELKLKPALTFKDSEKNLKIPFEIEKKWDSKPSVAKVNKLLSLTQKKPTSLVNVKNCSRHFKTIESSVNMQNSWESSLSGDHFGLDHNSPLARVKIAENKLHKSESEPWIIENKISKSNKGLHTTDKVLKRRRNELSKCNRESSRSDQESSRSDQESCKSDIESQKRDKESSRRDKETSRSDTESSRSDTESSRSDKEISRSDKESGRSDKETSWRDNELVKSLDEKWTSFNKQRLLSKNCSCYFREGCDVIVDPVKLTSEPKTFLGNSSDERTDHFHRQTGSGEAKSPKTNNSFSNDLPVQNSFVKQMETVKQVSSKSSVKNAENLQLDSVAEKTNISKKTQESCYNSFSQVKSKNALKGKKIEQDPSSENNHFEENTFRETLIYQPDFSREAATRSRNKPTYDSKITSIQHLMKGLCHGMDKAMCLVHKVFSEQEKENGMADTRDYHPNFNTELLHTCTVVGLSEEKSFAMPGFRVELPTGQIHLARKWKTNDIRVLMINGSLSPSFKHKGYKPPVKIGARFYRPGAVTPDTWTERVLRRVHELRVDMIMVTGFVEEDLRAELQCSGVLVAEAMKYNLLAVLAGTNSWPILTYVDDSNEEDVCHVKVSLRVDDLSINCLILTPSNCQPVWTIVVCHPSKDIALIREQQVWKCARRLSNALQLRAVLLGNGTTEGDLASWLLNQDKGENDFQSLVFEELAKGFLEFQGLVIKNSGGENSRKPNLMTEDLRSCDHVDGAVNISAEKLNCDLSNVVGSGKSRNMIPETIVLTNSGGHTIKGIKTDDRLISDEENALTSLFTNPDKVSGLQTSVTSMKDNNETVTNLTTPHDMDCNSEACDKYRHLDDLLSSTRSLNLECLDDLSSKRAAYVTAIETVCLLLQCDRQVITGADSSQFTKLL